MFTAIEFFKKVNFYMTINQMRRIDYWAGVPVCFFLTLLDKIFRLFSPSKKDKHPPAKILFLKPSEMGGIILSFPLMRRVKEQFPDAELFFLTFEDNKEIFSVLDVIPQKNVLTIRNRSFFTFIKDALRAVLKTRREKIDVVVDLEFFSRFTAVFSYLSGAKKRIGFHPYTFEGLYRGDLLTHKVAYNPYLHISEMFLVLGQAIKFPKKVTPETEPPSDAGELARPSFLPTERQKKSTRETLSQLGIPPDARLFLLNPGEGRIPLREWPLEHFVVLARKILEQKNHYIMVVGLDGSSQKAEKFSESVNNIRCVNLSGKTSMEELLTLFTSAHALIANDCGLAHLASLTEIQQFILFGPESPRIFAPRAKKIHTFYSGLPCSPCLSALNHRRSSCRDNICLKHIDPHRVYQVIADTLSSL